MQEAGIKVKPEVMIPLVGFKKELDLQVAVVHTAAKSAMAEKKVKLSYLVGTMIEVPRGGQTAEFFSFGTKDLFLSLVAAGVSPRHLARRGESATITAAATATIPAAPCRRMRS